MSGGLLLLALMIVPVVAAIALMLMPADKPRTSLGAALVLTGFEFFLSLGLLAGFKPGMPGMQFVLKLPWIETYGIDFHIGLDGISLFLVLLTTFTMPIVVLNAYSSVKDRVREYLVAMLLLEAGMLGAFVALDLVLFYVFWEMMLIPMYFIIGVWGGKRRVYAAVKFFLFTMAGSVLMLGAIVYLGLFSGAETFDLLRLYQVELSAREQFWLCGAFMLAFAIKVPVFPLHTWLPDAHVEAPTGGSVVLAAVLLKFGTYGFLRFAMPLFPGAAATFAPWMAGLAVAGIIYGSFLALAQSDMKKLVAYSSVAHLGYVMLGIFAMNPEGVVGGVYQMLNHGISTGALFLAVGVIYERRHTRELSQLGGIARRAPIYAAFTGLIVMSSIALPGTNGFIGEFLILLGTFTSTELPQQRLFAALGATGVILGAVYMLRMFRKLMLGPLEREENAQVQDLNSREIAMFLPLLALIIVMGVYPKFFTDRMQTSVNQTLAHITGKPVGSNSRVVDAKPKLDRGARPAAKPAANPMRRVEGVIPGPTKPASSRFQRARELDPKALREALKGNISDGAIKPIPAATRRALRQLRERGQPPGPRRRAPENLRPVQPLPQVDPSRLPRPQRLKRPAGGQ